jgi:RNA polymerase sigma-70 factor (ECF subfamily)
LLSVFRLNEAASGYAGSLVSATESLDREFEQRLQDSGTLAFRVAYGVLRQRQDAEDVAQEAFVRAHREFGRLRDRERFRSWLVRTTWRLAIDRWRSDRRRRTREEGADPPPTPSAEQIAVESERAALLWRAIDELPEKMRAVVVLSCIEGHDVAEVARLLDIPEGTVKSRLYMARKDLAGRLRWLVNT